MNKNSDYPVAIIGAGPVGLAAAAQLLARGERPLIIEKNTEIAGHIRSWEHVRIFSPWRYNIDREARRLLLENGWNAPSEEELPTGAELRELYLKPLAGMPGIRENLHLGAEVLSVGRLRMDRMRDAGREDAPFEIQVRNREGKIVTHLARGVIDATGTWSRQNPIGAGGRPAQGEKEMAHKIFYGIPDINGSEKQRYAGKRVMVVGRGHSAFQSLMELVRLREEYPETVIYWSMRGPVGNTNFGGGSDDGLPARGGLGEKLKSLYEGGELKILEQNRISSLAPHEDMVMVFSHNTRLDALTKVQVHEVISATGSRPDYSFLSEVRYSSDPSLESVPALAPLIDPNIHSCGSVRPHGEAELRQVEQDFYIIGSKAYGRAPTFLMATGYEQARSVVAALMGDMEAARRVELDLPETGVCSSDPAVATAGGCC